MMEPNQPYPFVGDLIEHKMFFSRAVSCLTEEDAAFQPRPDMLSVVGQIHHVTAAVELMLSGIYREFDRFGECERRSRRPGGTWFEWGMDWALHANRDLEATDRSLAGALQAFDETMDLAYGAFSQLTMAEMLQPLTPNPMQLATPRAVLHSGIIDHTAHHRGALAQYARLLGRDPQIPYFEMSEALHEAHMSAAA